MADPAPTPLASTTPGADQAVSHGTTSYVQSLAEALTAELSTRA